jgi:hypothetical protein
MKKNNEIPDQSCPDCGVPMDKLFFMGEEFTGYVCPRCNVLWDGISLHPLAKVY